MHDVAHHRAVGNTEALDSARAGREHRRRRCAVLVALGIALWPLPAFAHDPSAWGGLFRTRDGGATWSPANAGSFVSGAIALAVSPVDPHHLLLATDSGVSRSRNGGRDWEIEAPEVLVGPAFAVALDTDGRRALVSMGSVIFRNDGDGWRAIGAPGGAEPARAFVAGLVPGRVYLAGWSGLYRSDDWATSWTRASDGLPEAPVNALAVVPAPGEGVFAIVAGRLWASFDGARRWQPRDAGLPQGAVEAFTRESADPRHMWAAAAGQLFRSPDGGGQWRASGRPLPERNAMARGLAVSGPVIMVATARGVYRSHDGGERWEPPDENLPGHLEAGLLVPDPSSPSTIYAGFAVTGQDELRRRAAEGRSALMRLRMSDNLARGAAFFALLTLSAIVVLRHRVRSSYRTPQSESAPSEGGRAPRSR